MKLDRLSPHADDLGLVATRIKAMQIAKARQFGDVSPVGRMPHQMKPLGDWLVWMILGGRGSGKTWVGAREVIEYLRKYGANAWATIVGPTRSATKSVCLEGPSGLYTLYANEFPNIGTHRGYNKSEMTLHHIGGGRVLCFGAEEPARLNGPEHGMLWCDEVGVWAYKETFDQAILGLRHGQDPRAIVTTTPKSRQFISDLIASKDVVVTRGKTSENPHLAERARRNFYERYAGTRLERQELDGEMIEDIEGAMWRSEWIDAARVASLPPTRMSVLIVDPATSSMKDSDETAWSIVHLGEDDDFYITLSRGDRETPRAWGEMIVKDIALLKPARVIAEKNQGGEMVSLTLETAADKLGVDLDACGGIELFHTSKGKEERAAPIAMLYEQGRVHHVGYFEQLEYQQCGFPVDCEHDDRLDTVIIGVAWLIDWKEKAKKKDRPVDISANTFSSLLSLHKKRNVVNLDD